MLGRELAKAKLNAAVPPELASEREVLELFVAIGNGTYDQDCYADKDVCWKSSVHVANTSWCQAHALVFFFQLHVHVFNVLLVSNH